MIAEPGAATLARRDVVTPGSVVAEPWANSLGITRVLERRLAWRLSVAEIRGAPPFSAFPGLDRTLMVAGEEPLGLNVDGRVHRLAPGDVVRFSGEARAVPAPTSAGATVVNLMTPRALASHRCERIPLRGRLVVAPAQSRIVVVLTGAAELDGTPLPHGTALLPSAHERAVTGAGLLAQLTIIPLPAI